MSNIHTSTTATTSIRITITASYSDDSTSPATVSTKVLELSVGDTITNLRYLVMVPLGSYNIISGSLHNILYENNIPSSIVIDASTLYNSRIITIPIELIQDFDVPVIAEPEEPEEPVVEPEEPVVEPVVEPEEPVVETPE